MEVVRLRESRQYASVRRHWVLFVIGWIRMDDEAAAGSVAGYGAMTSVFMGYAVVAGWIVSGSAHARSPGCSLLPGVAVHPGRDGVL